MAQTILYYPTINIQDGTWLRNAILYWDEVSSIVPYENYPDFSPELLYLQELGVYKAVYPRNLVFSEFAEDFCNSIVKRISAYELRTTNNGTQNSRVRMHKNKIYAPALHELSEEDELWLEKYYKTAYKLLEKDSFQTAVHTMASYRWHSVPRVQLAVIWSGIESLFNVNTEVSFRISLYIANFLGENEAQAQQIFKQVRKMYSSRSSAVHGNKTKDNLESAVEESANLLTRILRRCAELNKLPDVDNLAFRVDKQRQGIKCKMLVP